MLRILRFLVQIEGALYLTSTLLFRWSCHVFCCVRTCDLQDISKDDSIGIQRKYEAYAEEWNVPLGNISRWLKQQKQIHAKAGELMKAKSLGVKPRKKAALCKESKARLVNKARKRFEDALHSVVEKRAQQKKGINLPAVQKIAKRLIAKMENEGSADIRVTNNGKQFAASKTWAFWFMVKNGWVSRVRTNRRNVTSAAMAVAMRKFVWFLRQIKKIGYAVPDEFHEEEESEVPDLEDVVMYDETKTKKYKKMDAVSDSQAVKEAKRLRTSEYGRFPFENTYNVDQVPFELDNNFRETYCKLSDQMAQMSAPCGANKRFGTLQVLHLTC